MHREYLKCKDKVEHILKACPNTRNSDKELIIKYACQFLDRPKNFADAIRKMPSFESITRARRKIQESGIYMADKKTQEARDREELMVAEEFCQQKFM